MTTLPLIPLSFLVAVFIVLIYVAGVVLILGLAGLFVWLKQKGDQNECKLIEMPTPESGHKPDSAG